MASLNNTSPLNKTKSRCFYGALRALILSGQKTWSVVRARVSVGGLGEPDSLNRPYLLFARHPRQLSALTSPLKSSGTHPSLHVHAG